jgi:hypothetical protein
MNVSVGLTHRVVERQFLGVDRTIERLVRLPESARLAVIGTEQPDGFIDVLYEDNVVRVLGVDLKDRSTLVKTA